MKNKQTALSIKIESDVKEKLVNLAQKKSMDMSKLARAILTNYVTPGTYSL